MSGQKRPQNPPQTLTGCGFQRFLPPQKYCSTFPQVLLRVWGCAMRRPEIDTQGAALLPSAGVMAASSGHADPHPSQAGFEAAGPFLADQQAPQGRAGVLGFWEEQRRAFVLAVAWWYEHVELAAACEVRHWFEIVGQRLWPAHWQRVADVAEQVVRNLLGDFIAWPIAEDHLRAKWEAWRQERNREFLNGGKR